MEGFVSGPFHHPWDRMIPFLILYHHLYCQLKQFLGRLFVQDRGDAGGQEGCMEKQRAWVRMLVCSVSEGPWRQADWVNIPAAG